MSAISSFIEVIQNPDEACADCGDATATHRLKSYEDGVETRAVLCKACLDRRVGPIVTGPCEFCGSPDGLCNSDPLLKMAGLNAKPRFACSRCEMVRMRLRMEALRTLQGEGEPTRASLEMIPKVLAEAERRAQEFIRKNPPRVNPRVFTISSMNGLAERIARLHEPCDTCGVAVAAYRVWSHVTEQETEVRLCEQCLPGKSPFMAMDFVPEDASCRFCGAPASFPSSHLGGPSQLAQAEEYECLRCSRLLGRYLSEAWSPELMRTQKDMGLEGMADLQRQVEQRVRDYFRDHPE
jgi:hypothetical protein